MHLIWDLWRDDLHECKGNGFFSKFDGWGSVFGRVMKFQKKIL